MMYKIYSYPLPDMESMYIVPIEISLYYQKYRERLHSVNIKNRNKWNRIRSNINNKYGRRLNYVDSKRT